MGRQREQPQGEVLPAHREGPQRAHRRHQPLAADDPRNRFDPRRIRRLRKEERQMNLHRYTQREKKDADLAEEIQSHLAHEEDANAARGLSSQEAHRQANLRFGNPRSTRERVWSYRSLPWIEDAWRDLRFVLRSLAKTPGFTVIAILVIAVGIGVNTAVFPVINTVLLKPLTYPDPQSLVMLMNTSPRGSFPGANVPKFNIWHQQTSIFQQVAGYDRGGAGLNLT